MSRTQKFAIALVTAPDMKVARSLASAALKARLVACANLLPGIESHYWWEGKIETGSEALILFKTKTERLPALEKLILELRGILESEAKLLALIKKELLEMKAKYTSPRRTEIVAAAGDFRMEDVVPNEGCVITVSHLGFIKRTPVAAYRAQKRGGKGVIGAETYEEDFIETLFTASTHDYTLFFTSSGQCLAKKVYDIPEGTRTAKGKSVSSFLRLNAGEKIAAMVCVKEFDPIHHIVMATKAGITKKTNLADYANATRESGLRGIKLLPMYAGFSPDDERLDPLWKYAAKHQLQGLFVFALGLGLTSAALARGEALRDLSVTRPSLEDVYIELTTEPAPADEPSNV